jgi:hypothetical protein
MPMQRALYPDNWEEIALAVKEAAGWVCQGCGKQCRRPGEPFTTHKNTLTVQHIDGVPANCAAGNLIALCAPCHLRADAKMHARHAGDTRRAKSEAETGQASLWVRLSTELKREEG